MKKSISILSAISLLLAFLYQDAMANNATATTSVTTVSADNITFNSALVKGSVFLGTNESNTSIDFVGFRYSLDESCPITGSTEVPYETVDSKNNYTATIKGLASRTKYYFRAVIRINGQETCGGIMTFTTLASNVPSGAVDLGIVITRNDGTQYSVYWAECNVGASKPEESGNFYAWGETELKFNYSWKTYKFYISGYDQYDVKFSKYNISDSHGPIDNKTILEPEDDAAYIERGGKWRIPTREEFRALIDQSTRTWVTQEGVYGIEVTGPNGNSIFLPISMSSGDFAIGEYWSSSLDTQGNTSNAWFFIFNQNGFRGDTLGDDRQGHRYNKRQIRPVYEE